MEGVLAQNLTADYGEGRGIVMVAGNADTLERVKWSLQMLRLYESKLPVQIVSRYHKSPLLIGGSITSRQNDRRHTALSGRK